MSDFIKLVMDNFTEVDKHILLKLNLSVFVDLDATGVNDSHVSDEVSSIFADNHELIKIFTFEIEI